jgi:Uma2 family endonuclease
MATLPDAPLTEEQYLQIERLAEAKSEFHDGQMFAMAGSSANHSLLANNVGGLLRSGIPKGCRAFNLDLRIKVSDAGLYTYPDCSVVCGDLKYFGDRKDVIMNPMLIVEILSPSTEGYDRGRKFEMYRTLDTFTEYLLVHQDRRHVEHYSKQDDGAWLLREFSGEGPTIEIARLGMQIPMAELYSSAIDLSE